MASKLEMSAINLSANISSRPGVALKCALLWEQGGGPDYVLVDIPYAFRIGYPSDSIRQESQSLLNSPSAVADLPTVQAIDIPR